MRLATHAAIQRFVNFMDALVTTSGAVSFEKFATTWGFGKDGPTVLHFVCYSYSTPIGGFIVPEGKTVPLLCWMSNNKHSVTTSKHQTWLAGAIHRFITIPNKMPAINLDVPRGTPLHHVEERLKVEHDVQTSERGWQEWRDTLP